MSFADSWLKIDFWRTILEQVVHWFIRSGPTIVVILALAAAAFKILGVSLVRLKRWLIRRASTQHAELPSEIEKRLNTLVDILATALHVMVWCLVSILILREIGVDIAPLVAGAGVIGVAAGFGAQNLIRDLIAGFFILLENQIRVGDVVQINGTGGLVENIGLRTITLRDLSGVVHIFANGSINTLSNMTKDWSAMVFDIGVAYKENTDRVVQVMHLVARELQADKEFGEKIIAPLEVFGVDRFEESAVIIKARLKTRPIAQWDVGREYNRRLKKVFEKEGITIPYPHRTLCFEDMSKPLPVLLKHFSD